MNIIGNRSQHDPENIVNGYADRTFKEDYGVPCPDEEAMTLKEVLKADPLVILVGNALRKVIKHRYIS